MWKNISMAGQTAEKAVTLVARNDTVESMRHIRQSKASAPQISVVGVTGKSKRVNTYLPPIIQWSGFRLVLLFLFIFFMMFN